MSQRCERRGAGFSLIEMIAVVLIAGLLLAVVAPGVGRLVGRNLGDAADLLAARLELARQRSVMTGVPHRVWIDLDQGLYRLEWLATEAEQAQQLGEAVPPPRAEPQDLGASGHGPLDLAPPRAEERLFRPFPGQLGRDERLDDSLGFRGVETDEGWIERGQTAVEFEADGTAAHTKIVLLHEPGDARAIDVLPLADAVRVSHAEE